MITIFSGTNRVNSNSLKVAESYQQLLDKKGIDNQVFDLSKLPATFMTEDMYGLRTNETKEIIEKYVVGASHYVFAIPEYNGSFPGALKLFVDGVEPKFFNHKSALLVGVSTGRAGNLRGLDAFANVLNHLQVEVLSNKVLLSQVNLLMDEEGVINHEPTLEIIDNQLETFKRVYSL